MAGTKTWSRGLSPFILGPCELWGGRVSKNMENAWQYSKVYGEFLRPRVPGDSLGPHDMGMAIDLPRWLEWATAGWAKSRADRYPMGRGRTPAFSYWDGMHFGYIEARAKIYVPLYWNAARGTDAWQLLVGACRVAESARQDLVLRDFDGYDHRALGMSLIDVLNSPGRKMGHAFVLAMMLKELGIE